MRLTNALLLLLLAHAVRGQVSPLPARPLTCNADIRALSREQAAAAIYASRVPGSKAEPAARSDGPLWNLTGGEEIEMEGLTSAGGYAPVVIVQHVRVLGPGRPLPVRQVSVAHLNGGHEDAQRLEVGALRLFRPERVPGHRPSVEGTAAWASEKELVIQAEDRGVRVHETSIHRQQEGDLVLVSGLIQAKQLIANFTHAIVKRLSPGTPPPYVALGVEDILDQSRDNSGRAWGLDPKDSESRFVRVKGTLTGNPTATTVSCLLQTSTGKQVTVNLPAGSTGFPQAPLAGSAVEVTGISSVRLGPGDPLPEFRRPLGVEVLLHDASDPHLVGAPSWWTLQRLKFALVSAAAVLGLVLAWFFLLRRTVESQALRLETALRVPRNAELEHEAAKRERIRLAGNLHDGVYQLLNAASYRLESGARLSALNPAAALPHITAAKKILDRSQHELRSIMWGIHELAKEEPDFSGLLSHALAGMDHWPADVVKVSSEGTAQPVPARAAGSLLLLIQEAVQNALFHGRATEINVQVTFSNHGLGLTIRDNGQGFEPGSIQPTPQGGLGLGSMKRRVQELGGTIFLTSAPGQGTSLSLDLPWARLQPLFPEKTNRPSPL